MKQLSLILAFLIAAPVFAATHYVSTSGADTNAGTSEGSPWAHLPGMINCANNCSSYTPSAGDSFVLRGCDDWGNSNFPIAWTWSGTSGNPITIGVDKTWFKTSTCSFWNRPKFDAQGSPTVGRGAECSANGNNAFIQETASYNSWAWIELPNWSWANGSCTSIVEGYVYISGSSSVGNDTFDNFYIHGFKPQAGAADFQTAFVVSYPGAACNVEGGTTSTCTVSNSVINNCDVAGGTGGVTQMGASIFGLNSIGNIFQCVFQAIKTTGGGEIAYNNISRIAETGSGHPNCIETIGGSP